MVTVDTSVRMQAFRVSSSAERSTPDSLLRQNQVVMVGPVLAEILQGARNLEEIDRLRVRLAALPYAAATRETWDQSGALSYQLRQQGETVGLVDLLISALALEYDHQLYTLDDQFQRVSGLRLYSSGS
jgi:predicted nucleic acid-binding protein